MSENACNTGILVANPSVERIMAYDDRTAPCGAER